MKERDILIGKWREIESDPAYDNFNKLLEYDIYDSICTMKNMVLNHSGAAGESP